MTNNNFSGSELPDNELSLLDLVPQVLRARDFRLYTRDGCRLTDLWQNGGASVLGHTPPSLLREIKNTASRGLYAPFPHFTGQRFIKALSQILPGRNFRIYAAPPGFFSGGTGGILKNGRAAIWRPFLDFCLPDAANANDAVNAATENAAAAGKNPQLVIPVLPGIQGWRGGLPFGLCVYAFLPGYEKANELPPGDFLPPVLLAAATRGIYDLIAASPVRVKNQLPRINKALRDSRWQRRGIYLFLRQSAGLQAWADLFERFLDAGFLLPPVQEHPLILPGVLSPGEEVKLAQILQI